MVDNPFIEARNILLESEKENISPSLILRHRCNRNLDQFLLSCTTSLLLRWGKNENNISKDNSINEDLSIFRKLKINERTHIMLLCIQSAIDSFVSTLLHSTYTEAYLPACKSWYRKSIIPFIEEIYQDSIANMYDLSKRINSFILASVSRSRTKELFEIIADYPDSSVAILELRDTSQSTDNQTHIGRSFRQVVCKRLLHPGASTNQILDMYISVVRAFRVLDPSDLLLNYVAQPIREYLKSRKDTVRCVVSSLAQGKESDLHNELRQGSSLEFGQDEDHEEAACAENWVPRKRNTELSDTGLSGLDVLALLVSIYGSTDVFVKEYRQLLGSNLLHNLTFQIDDDMVTLEHLKKRFGEESLHSAEVMLHDLEDSRRVNVAITAYLKQSKEPKKQLNTTSPEMDMAIVSDNYWPDLDSFDGHAGDLDGDELFKHHPSAQQWLSWFEAAYLELKKPRRLEPLPMLGQVQLSLEFEGGVSRSFSVSPLQVSNTLFMSLIALDDTKWMRF